MELRLKILPARDLMIITTCLHSKPTTVFTHTHTHIHTHTQEALASVLCNLPVKYSQLPDDNPGVQGVEYRGKRGKTFTHTSCCFHSLGMNPGVSYLTLRVTDLNLLNLQSIDKIRAFSLQVFQHPTGPLHHNHHHHTYTHFHHLQVF